MKCVVNCLLLLLAYLAVYSQSYFHNTQQFGLRSTLLGGSIIAGNEDLSMAYYNPAALRYAGDRGFNVAVVMPSFHIYRFGDYFRDGASTKRRGVSLSSSLITIKPTFGKRMSLVVALVQKDAWNNSISYSEVNDFGPIRDTRSFQYSHGGKERLLGFGGHLNLSKALSIGFSQFLSFAKTDYEYTISHEEFDKSTFRQKSYLMEELDLHYSSTMALVTKLGFCFDRKGHRIGLVVTTPTYAELRNGGRFLKTFIKTDEESSQIESTLDLSLNSEVIQPWQLQAGIATTLRDSSEIWLSISYHNAIEDHDIFKVQKSSGDSIALRGGYLSVTNVSIGMSKPLSPKSQLLTSFRTNFMAYDNEGPKADEERIQILDANKFHFTAGIKTTVQNSSFVMGLDWSIAAARNHKIFRHLPHMDLFAQNRSAFLHSELTLFFTYKFLLKSVSRNFSKVLDS